MSEETRLRADGPLYVRAARQLERLINATDLAPGDRLPSEAQLAERLGVSRSTVREALRELELAGQIDRSHGRATTVARPAPIITGLPALESLESLAARQGWRCGTENVRIEEMPLLEDLAVLLEVPTGHPATYLSRIKTRDWRPVARMETWLPATLLSASELQDRFENSITDLLRAGNGVRLDYAIAQVSATAADPSLSESLRVRAESPLVVLSELFFQNPARPICYSRNLFVPDSIQLEVLRRPAS
jgi:GntR family transcriptional regulator